MSIVIMFLDLADDESRPPAATAHNGRLALANVLYRAEYLRISSTRLQKGKKKALVQVLAQGFPIVVAHPSFGG